MLINMHLCTHTHTSRRATQTPSDVNHTLIMTQDSYAHPPGQIRWIGSRVWTRNTWLVCGLHWSDRRHSRGVWVDLRSDLLFVDWLHINTTAPNRKGWIEQFRAENGSYFHFCLRSFGFSWFGALWSRACSWRHFYITISSLAMNTALKRLDKNRSAVMAWAGFGQLMLFQISQSL